MPGYWTGGEKLLGLDGKPAGGKWLEEPLKSLHVAYYQRNFAARPEWKTKNAFLHFDGVDGLAQVFLNGRHVDWLPGYEYADFDIGPALRYDAENTLTIMLVRDERKESTLSGIYGNVSLRLLGSAALNDLVVRPSVEKGRIAFFCDVWNAGEPSASQLEFEVTAAGRQAKRGSGSFILSRWRKPTARRPTCSPRPSVNSAISTGRTHTCGPTMTRFSIGCRPG